MTVLEMVAPAVLREPPNVISSAGVEAIEFAELCGISLDPWQAWAVDQCLSERAGNRWAAFENAVVGPRQNGKNFVLRVVQIAGLYLFGDRLMTHSAHLFKTCDEHRRWLCQLLESSPYFQSMLKPIDPRTKRSKSFVSSHGQEQVELTTGQRIIFVARERGNTKGFTGDKVFFDEAQFLKAYMMGDTVPILSTSPGAQVYYTANACMADSQVMDAVRNRAINPDPADRLFYAEWGNNETVLDLEPGCDEYMAALERANPAVAAGRIGRDYVEQEIRTFSGDPELVEAHRRERLGVPTMPIKIGARNGLGVDLDVWGDLHDPASVMTTQRRVGLAVSDDQRWSAIGRAGRRDDGLLHMESFWRAPGTGWVLPKARELARMANDANEEMVLLIGAGTQAASMLKDLEAAAAADRTDGPRWSVNEVSGVDQARGVGMLVSAVNNGTIRHLNQSDLNIALEYAAVSVSTGGAKRFAPTKSKKDISPLEACTLAVGAIPDLTDTPQDMFAI